MLPRAIATALQFPKLEAVDFTATKFDSSVDKTKFGNHLLRFIAEDFPKTLWTKVFYRRLSMIFSNIAHYNEHGFWETWFETTADQIDFLQNIAHYPCWGDPAFTYSDVETIIGKRVKNCGVIAWKQKLLVEDRKKKDLAQLARLKEIYEPENVPPLSQLPVAASPDMTQIDLFS
jgi:hypothetical protein